MITMSLNDNTHPDNIEELNEKNSEFFFEGTNKLCHNQKKYNYKLSQHSQKLMKNQRELLQQDLRELNNDISKNVRKDLANLAKSWKENSYKVRRNLEA